MTGTLEALSEFVCSSARKSDCFGRSGLLNFKRVDPVFIQKRSRSSVRGDMSIIKWPWGRDVASRYQSNSSDPKANCALSVLTCITSRRNWMRKMCAFQMLTYRPSLLYWNKLCLNVNSNQSKRSSRSSENQKNIWIANLFLWIVKD